MEIIYVSAYRPHVEVTNVIREFLQRSEYCDFLHQLFNHCISLHLPCQINIFINNYFPPQCSTDLIIHFITFRCFYSCFYPHTATKTEEAKPQTTKHPCSASQLPLRTVTPSNVINTPIRVFWFNLTGPILKPMFTCCLRCYLMHFHPVEDAVSCCDGGQNNQLGLSWFKSLNFLSRQENVAALSSCYVKVAYCHFRTLEWHWEK